MKSANFIPVYGVAVRRQDNYGHLWNRLNTVCSISEDLMSRWTVLLCSFIVKMQSSVMQMWELYLCCQNCLISLRGKWTLKTTTYLLLLWAGENWVMFVLSHVGICNVKLFMKGTCVCVCVCVFVSWQVGVILALVLLLFMCFQRTWKWVEPNWERKEKKRKEKEEK